MNEQTTNRGGARGIADDLRDLPALAEDVRNYQERMARLRAAAEGLTRQMHHGSPGTAVHDRMAELVSKLTDLELGLAEKVIAREMTIGAVEQAVEALPEAQRRVLQLRYFEGKRWREVAKAMCYSDRRCLQLHEAGMNALWSMGQRSVGRAK